MPSVVLRRQISGSRSTESATFKNMEKSTIIWYTGIPVFFSITAMYFVYNFRATWLIRLWQRWNVWRAGASEAVLKITDELQISYLERKSESIHDEILLMVHGFTGCKENYCDLTRLFPKNFHIILIDLPGHGETIPHDVNGDYTITNQVENLHKFVKAFGFGERKINMIGFSMGGHIAGVYAARYGDTLSSVVLCCPAGIDTPEVTEFIQDSRANHHKGNLLLPQNAKEMKEMLKEVLYHDIKLSDQIAAALVKLKKQRMHVYKKVMSDIVKPSQHFVLDGVLEDIQVPLLCIWGMHDKILHVSGSDVIKQRVKNSEVQIIERCGHAIPLDRPRKLLKIILEFLGKIIA